MNAETTEIKFVHNENHFGIYKLDEIEEITFTINNKDYEVEDKDSEEKPIGLFISFIVVGALGTIVLFIMWLKSNKIIKQTTTELSIITEDKDAKYECSYCKCIFNIDKESKCPSCGAPPKSKKE